MSHGWKRVVARRGVDGMAGVPLYSQSLEPGIAKGLGGRTGKEGTVSYLRGRPREPWIYHARLKIVNVWRIFMAQLLVLVGSDCLSRILYTREFSRKMVFPQF